MDEDDSSHSIKVSISDWTQNITMKYGPLLSHWTVVWQGKWRYFKLGFPSPQNPQVSMTKLVKNNEFFYYFLIGFITWKISSFQSYLLMNNTIIGKPNNTFSTKLEIFLTQPFFSTCIFTISCHIVYDYPSKINVYNYFEKFLQVSCSTDYSQKANSWVTP